MHCHLQSREELQLKERGFSPALYIKWNISKIIYKEVMPTEESIVSRNVKTAFCGKVSNHQKFLEEEEICLNERLL